MKATNHRTWHVEAVLTAFLIASLVTLPAPRPARAAAASGPIAKPTAVDAAGVRRKLASLRGKIVVLNLWATWCGPCVMEFPELVRFERAYRSRGVAVVGLSMDDPQKAPTLVPPFLRKQRPGFPVYIMKPGDPQQVIEAIDKNWEGAIPMTYVYDRTGQLRTRLQGARGIEQFELAVKPLLK